MIRVELEEKVRRQRWESWKYYNVKEQKTTYSTILENWINGEPCARHRASHFPANFFSPTRMKSTTVVHWAFHHDVMSEKFNTASYLTKLHTTNKYIALTCSTSLGLWQKLAAHLLTPILSTLTISLTWPDLVYLYWLMLQARKVNTLDQSLQANISHSATGQAISWYTVIWPLAQCRSETVLPTRAMWRFVLTHSWA